MVIFDAMVMSYRMTCGLLAAVHVSSTGGPEFWWVVGPLPAEHAGAGVGVVAGVGVGGGASPLQARAALERIRVAKTLRMVLLRLSTPTMQAATVALSGRGACAPALQADEAGID